MNDLSVTVKADTDEFVESIEEATEAVEELQAALERLEQTGVSINIGTTDKADRLERAIVDLERDVR